MLRTSMRRHILTLNSLYWWINVLMCVSQAIQVDVEPLTAPASRVELKPVPFGAYHSPLLAFKSYRSAIWQFCNTAA